VSENSPAVVQLVTVRTWDSILLPLKCSIGAITEMQTFKDEFGELTSLVRGLVVSVNSASHVFPFSGLLH
jgi:hypothetical protein